MSFDWWTLGLETVNVAVLIWILARFLFRPVTRIIAERQDAAHAALDEAEAARAEAEAAREAVRAETEAFAAARADRTAEAREEAARERQRLLEAARAEAAKVRAASTADLDRMREVQEQALTEQAGALAADIAARLFARLPDMARIDGFIDGLAEAVAALPEATQNGIGADGPIRLRAARDLTPDERDVLLARLQDVLHRELTVEIDTAPELLAGLELDTPHAIVRNHFRADLDRIRAELTDHD